ncbi:MAG TPA: hypothetical protein VK437_10825 [Steroidobacteraceae bacterium]|nr:hypothetical protein [Steroidobacteraceae bacterium]
MRSPNDRPAHPIDAQLVQAVGEYAAAAAAFLVTPAVWALSMPIGGWVLARARWGSR